MCAAPASYVANKLAFDKLPESIQSLFYDFASLEQFESPVILESGHTASRASIEDMINRLMENPFQRGGLLTRQKDLTPNPAIAELMKDPSQAILDPLTHKPLISPVVYLGTEGTSYERSASLEEINAYRMARGLSLIPAGSKAVPNRRLEDVINAMNQWHNKEDQKLAGEQINLEGMTLEALKLQANNAFEGKKIYDAKKIYEYILSKHNASLKDEERAAIHTKLANICNTLSEFLSAVEHYAKLEYIPGVSNLDKAKALLKSGDILRIVGQKDKSKFYDAVVYYGKAHAFAMQSANTSDQLITAGLILENTYWAIKAMDPKAYVQAKGYQISPEEFENRQKQDLQAVLESLKEFCQFYLQFTKAAGNLETDPLPHWLLAKYCLAAKKYDEAIPHAANAYNALLKVQPDAGFDRDYAEKIRLQYAISFMDKCVKYKDKEQKEKVEIAQHETIAEFLAGEPAKIAELEAEHRSAFEGLKIAINLYPNNPGNRSIFYAAGRIAQRLGNFTEAARIFDISLSMHKNDNQTRVHKAAVLWAAAKREANPIKRKSLLDEALASLMKLDLNDEKASPRDVKDYAYYRDEIRILQNAGMPDICGFNTLLDHIQAVCDGGLQNVVGQAKSFYVGFGGPALGLGAAAPLTIKERIDKIYDGMTTLTSWYAYAARQAEFNDGVDKASMPLTKLYAEIFKLKLFLNAQTKTEDWEIGIHEKCRTVCDMVLNILDARYKAQGLQKISLRNATWSLNQKQPWLKLPTPLENTPKAKHFIQQGSGNLMGRSIYTSLCQGPNSVASLLYNQGAIANEHLDAAAEQGKVMRGIRFIKGHKAPLNEQSKELQDWDNDVEQMFFANPNFPNIDEFYLALKKMADYPRRSADIQPLIDYIDEKEKELMAKGFKRMQTCNEYATSLQSIRRTTLKPDGKQHGSMDTYISNYKDPVIAQPARDPFGGARGPGR